jgi:hypothetical protein
LLIGISIFSLEQVWAAEVCVPEYRPISGKYLVSRQEAEPLALSATERSTVMSAWQEYGEKIASRQQEFALEKAGLIDHLNGRPANREEADIAALRMLAALEQIARMGVDWQRALSGNISIGRMSTLAGAHRKSFRNAGRTRCGMTDSRLGIPLLRYDLNSREKALIALGEDELRTLNQFSKNNARLRDEYRALVDQLDDELARREPNSAKLDSLLKLMMINIRQDTINAFDSYFYGDAHIFTPERMAQLRAYWDKHKKNK